MAFYSRLHILSKVGITSAPETLGKLGISAAAKSALIRVNQR
jgi:hypothetical protein